jgi:hypothetical protein
MPTVRPRHAVIETDDITSALRIAARRWPADRDRPSVLIRHLIEAGATAAARGEEDAIALRRAAIRAASGSMTGVYEPGYLERLRDEWPE